ncbi:TIGR03745 family integrating conjugative element membrane protein [uncultured Pseudoteredinibacter sp.]|uniref:TIGR03745 family integrating conjugative element membrane protein n=1 Tax=uncultured Pseudoteredinibacter sp. TaxID=1641701 RepID=UPI00260D3EE0|nr:TIGR03745 family integrating conjugative element membrane protein [uncultured Pseudoteredinibacter sp.]
MRRLFAWFYLWRNHLKHRWTFLLFSFLAMQANADLPTPVDPSNGSPNGNYLVFMQGWTGDAIEYIALAISGAGFLWVGWILLSKFNEARSSNDPDWGSVGLTAVIAGVLLAVVSFFLNEAVGII